MSADPATNIGQVFDITIGNTITEVATVPGLAALEIDPEQAAKAYRERIIAPKRGLLPEIEIASFNEFANLLTDTVAYGQYNTIIFDTAPSGHAIRLLQLPGS